MSRSYRQGLPLHAHSLTREGVQGYSIFLLMSSEILLSVGNITFTKLGVCSFYFALLNVVLTSWASLFQLLTMIHWGTPLISICAHLHKAICNMFLTLYFPERRQNALEQTLNWQHKTDSMLPKLSCFSHIWILHMEAHHFKSAWENKTAKLKAPLPHFAHRKTEEPECVIKEWSL